jgi:hypothetical protein
LNSEVRPVERGGNLVETEFKIKASAQAFAILSSGLYSNKIRAIIRELSCNAYDAHVAAGKKDVPIEIKLPTVIDPTFYVKDFGIGLDEDGIRHIYTTYFESTKAESDDYIGQLGLGSKSPLSYTQSFSVEARFNGVKSFYTVFVSEKGTPTIAKLSEEATDEGNGLTVSLQVRPEDHSTFHREAQYALMYFDPKPNVVGRHGFETYSLEHTVVGDTWKLRTTDYYAGMQGPYVMQGFVAYPLNTGVLREANLSAQAQAVLGLNIDLYVPIGSVEVAASREALSYTKRTIANLAARLEEVAADLHATIQKQFDNAKTLWDAHMLFMELGRRDNDENKALSTVFTRLRHDKPFTWHGQAIDDEMTLDVGAYKHTQVIIFYKSRSRKGLQRKSLFDPESKDGLWQEDQKCWNFTIPLRAGLPVIIADGAGGNDILRQYLEAKGKEDHDGSKYAIVLRPLSRKEIDKSRPEMVKILASLGNPEPKLMSALGYTAKKQKSYYVKRDKNVLYQWNGFLTNGGYKRNQFNRSYSKGCWTTTEVDFEDGGLYVPIDRFVVMHNGREMMYIDDMIDAATALGIDLSAGVIGMNEKELALASQEGEWENLIDLVETEFRAQNTNNALVKPMIMHEVKKSMGEIDRVLKMMKRSSTKLVQCDLRDVMEEMAGVSSAEEKHWQRLFDALRMKAEAEEIKTAVEAFKAKWNQAIAKYEMLSFISWSTIYDADRLEKVINYINMIETHVVAQD